MFFVISSVDISTHNSEIVNVSLFTELYDLIYFHLNNLWSALRHRLILCVAIF